MVNRFVPGIPDVTPQQPVKNRGGIPDRSANGKSFRDVLTEKTSAEGLKISSHASARMQQNGIEFSGEQIKRLNSAVEKAGSKGIRESLVLLDGMALVVGINNRTVITVVEPERMKDRVFTNIDGAVIG